jgi:predicted metalloprotease with PDZ domain
LIRNLLVALAALGLMGAGPAPDPVRYRVAPVLADGVLAALAVEVRLRGDPDGQTVLELPGKGADGTERWRLLSDLTVDGAETRSDGDDKRVLTHTPGAAIVVRYRVRSAYSLEPPADNPPLKGPMLRPGWFMAPGFIFVTPQGRDDAPAAFEWGPLPDGWKAASNLEHGAAGQPMTVQNVFDGILIGGRGLTTLTRRISGAHLRVAVLPAAWKLPPDRIADTLARVIVGQRAFWGDLDTPFFVGVTPMPPSEGRGSVGGFGRWQGFALFAAVNSQPQIFEGNIAHEHTHAWIPTRIGWKPNGRAQVGQYWLSEGFTDFFGDRTLLRSGIWTPRSYVMALNVALRRYGASPIRNAPNSEIVAKAFSDPAFTRLPYDRGRLLAILWDRRLTKATHGRYRLDHVVFRMRDHFLAAPADAKPGTVDNLIRSYRELSGLDLSDDIARYVERGETIVLPENLFTPCRVVTVTRGGQTFQRVEGLGETGWSACEPRLTGRTNVMHR